MGMILNQEVANYYQQRQDKPRRTQEGSTSTMHEDQERPLSASHYDVMFSGCLSNYLR